MIRLIYNLPSVLELMVGIDELPITKNPPSQLWPILGYFSNITEINVNVFIIGCYYGKSKPEDSNEFLQEFVNELCSIINIGIAFNNVYIKVKLKALICDTPAKSYILNVKGHTGKKSCVRCQILGDYENNRVCFPNLNSPLRTHKDFIDRTDIEFHSGFTILVNILQFDLVNAVPFDYMHSVCIGVMKKLLIFWNGGVKRHRLALPHNLISVLNDNLNKLGQYIPEEFQRAPNINSRKHPIQDASHWKATELRQFLLYTGMVVLLDIVDKEVYDHFMQLCIAIRILLTSNISDEYINYAKSLIHNFVASFPYIYGRSYMSHNVHIILHLADDVKIFGPLNNFSAFPFESYMQPLKRKIKNGVKPLQQLVRRYAEEKICQLNREDKKINIGPLKMQNKLQNLPITENGCEPQFTGWMTEKFVLKLNKADSCVKMKNGDIVLIENLVTSKLDRSILIIGRKYETVKEFFNMPCSSHLLNMYSVTHLSYLNLGI